ncbi:hypothetical protein WR25_21582 [Diploscapter pachys]|uniref:Uncharacterized protein n=1 Tax=Diploscapter pachys TaxID=2018661 RepID=A0A2A2M2K8_9BILA|nr:hypothetical protein WR25_21582 [Diploscapter pachys]
MVVGPFRTTTAPVRRAAARARSSKEPALSPNRALNSPACGVRMTGWDRPASVSGSSRCSASPSMISARSSAAISALRRCRASSSRPSPGPIRMAPIRGSVSASAS